MILASPIFESARRLQFRVVRLRPTLKRAFPNSNPLLRAERDPALAVLPPQKLVSQWSNPPISRSRACLRWRCPTQSRRRSPDSTTGTDFLQATPTEEYGPAHL